MTRTLTYCLLFACFLVPFAEVNLLRSQHILAPILFPPPAAATPSPAFVISGSNFNTSAGSTYTVAPTAGSWCSSAGNLLVVAQVENASSTNAPSVPTDGGDTFVQDATITTSGRITYFSFPNCSSSRATITMHPGASRWSSATVYEFSGMATASPFDKASAITSNSGSTSWNGYSLATASNHLGAGIMTAFDNTAKVQYTAGTGWTIPAACNSTPWCGQGQDGDGGLSAYFINKQGQFGTFGTRSPAATLFTAVAFYKAASNGTVSGSYPSMLTNFSGGTNGNVPAAADLASGTIGGQTYNSGVNAWSVVGTATGATYTNTHQQGLTNQSTTQGTTTAAGGSNLGVKWNPSVMATNADFKYIYITTSNTATVCHEFWYDATTNPTVVLTNITEIAGNNGGRATPLVGYNGGAADVIELETSSGNCLSSPSNACNGSAPFTLQPNELYYICLKYNGVAAASSSLTMYDCGGLTATCDSGTWTTMGTISQAGQPATTDQPANFTFGHVSGGSQNVNYYVYNLQFDWQNATTPILP